MNREKLEGLVAELERIYGIRILMLTESSSRAWGLATKSSDHDIAFIYHQLPWMKKLEDTSNNIHYTKFEGVDFRGYDIRRSFALACNSNLGMYEMLYSPLRYAQDDQTYKLMKLAVDHYYAPGVLFDSLCGHTKKILLKNSEVDPIESITSKDLQYMIRFACMAQQVYGGSKLHTDMNSIRPADFTTDDYDVLTSLRDMRAGDYAKFKEGELFQRVVKFAYHTISLRMQNRPPRPIDETFYAFANVQHTLLQHWCAQALNELEYNEASFK